MRKNLTEIVFILDRSGSMSGLETDTIGGFNSMIEKQKKENGEALISTVLFDNVSEVMGLWKTPFTAHGKAKVRLSHVLQTAFPTAPKEQPVTHIPTPPTATEKDPFLPVIHKKYF